MRASLERALTLVLDQLCIWLYDADETAKIVFTLVRVSKGMRHLVHSSGLKRLNNRLNPCDVCAHHSKHFIPVRAESKRALASTFEWLELRRTVVLRLLRRQPCKIFTTLMARRAISDYDEWSQQQLLNMVKAASVKFSQSVGSRYKRDSHIHGHDEAEGQEQVGSPHPPRATSSVRWYLLKKKEVRSSLPTSSQWRSLVTALTEAVYFDPTLVLRGDDSVEYAQRGSRASEGKQEQEQEQNEEEDHHESRLFFLLGSDEVMFPELSERCKGNFKFLSAVHLHRSTQRDRALVCFMHGQLVQYLVDNAFFKAPPPPPTFISRLWRRIGWSKKEKQQQQL